MEGTQAGAEGGRASLPSCRGVAEQPHILEDRNTSVHEPVHTLSDEVQGLREEVKTERQLQEVATSHAMEGDADAVLVGNARVADLLGFVWGPRQGVLRSRSIVLEPVGASGGWGAAGTASLGPAGGRLGPV